MSSPSIVGSMIDTATGGSKTMVLNMGPQHPSTHGVLRILLELDGDPDLGIWSSRGRTIYSHRGLVGLSRRRGKRTDSLEIKNTTGHATVGYAAVGVSAHAQRLDAAYVLRVCRLHGR